MALREVEQADNDGGTDDGDQDAGHAPAAPQQQDGRQCSQANRKSHPIHPAGQDGSADRPQVPQGARALDREAEQLRELADQDGQGDAVHIAIADRLGQELGHEAQARQPGQDQDRPRYERHHAAQDDGALRVPGGQR